MFIDLNVKLADVSSIMMLHYHKNFSKRVKKMYIL